MTEQTTDLVLIDQFKGEYHFLSNFYIAELVWDGIVWPHSEAAYQAAKTLDRETRLRFATMTPGATKRAGRTLEIRPDWEEVKFETMYDIVRCKFEQNPELKGKLLDTGNAYLKEGNFHKDNIWGVCPPDNPNGKNWLGKILMSLRDEWQGITQV